MSLDLDAIEARAQAASPGPWETVRHDLTLYVVSESHELNPISLGYVGNRPEPDAEFIAHARTDVPALLALVREQQDKLEKVEALAEKWRYKGEFGWGAWQEGHGPDPEGYVLDSVAGEIRAALTATDPS
jgi:hypothetical protein